MIRIRSRGNDAGAIGQMADIVAVMIVDNVGIVDIAVVARMVVGRAPRKEEALIAAS